MSVMLLFLRRKTGPLGGSIMLRTLSKTAIASAGMALSLWICNNSIERLLDMSSKTAQIASAVIGVVVGFVVFMLLARLLKIKEEAQVREIIAKRFKRN